jgi:ubiquinone/menaquinone biosynthesis C-methylase UbiE
MDRAEMIELIRGGVLGAGRMWADLGAGTGNFTWALRELLGADGVIYAVDRDGKAIRAQNELLAQAGPGAAVIPTQADITRPLELPLLDGVLIANTLHFIRDQPAALALIAGYVRPGGRVLVVEYDLAEPLRWVPFPVPFAHFQSLAAGAGLRNVARVGRRVSPSSGVAMYAAVAVCQI